ncbi:MAG TPA: ABC transporter ATP-binding protein, partial [Gemmatimonadaceae bacterium]|nr:ABC transporter ATP-binding protein [Gemmatimonadaceae bacterium]
RDASTPPPEAGEGEAHPASPVPHPAIIMRDVEKSFGAVRANRGASLEVAAGEVHALVGENGAGKSTLMRLLAGLYAPDAGTIEVNGRDVTGWSTADAIAAGVGMVHQHFMLVPTLTVAENVVLGREPRRGVAIDMARAILEVQGIAEQFGFRIDARRFVRDLSVGEQQRVEIIKILFRGARILILDEPTAVLSPPEVVELWRVVRRLREGGGTIVLITHKLDEVMEVSDRITVMRHGQTIAQMATRDTTPAEIAQAMVGRAVALVGTADERQGVRGDERAAAAISLTPHPSPHTPRPESPLLDVRDLVVEGTGHKRALDGISFSVLPGEILGIAGVEGNGQTELVEAIAGLRRIAGGQILMAAPGGNALDISALSVRERIDAGLAHIPEDRHRRGLILEYSVADNLILGAQQRYVRGLQLDAARIADDARSKVQQYDIRPPDPALPVRALSGGNQQKVVIAREMDRSFSVLLAAQPTRGVDVGAIEFIHAELREARAAGKAILLVSAELAEIFALADRVAVMYGGRVVGMMPRAEATTESLGPLMTGAHARTGAA